MTTSIEPYPSYTFHANTSGPRLLVSAGVHGDEYEPMLAARLLVEKIAGLLTHGSVTIVPIVNRTAFARRSRFGGDGLDLARVCPGNSKGSATERDAAFISEKISQTDYYIDLHTGGALFDIFPLAGYMLHADQGVLDKQRMMARSFNLPLVWGTESKPNGRTLSVARDHSKPAIYVEYGGGGSGINQSAIDAMYEGCLNVMHSLGMTDRSPGSIKEPDFFVEDDRPDGGYLQGKLPAAHDGVFRATRTIGSVLAAGDIIGTITDPLHGASSEVHADIDGLLFFIRLSACVKTGESLGGILPLT